MKYSVSALVVFLALTSAAPQGVTKNVSPPGTPICAPDFSGNFQISLLNASSPSTKLRKRQDGTLVLSLSGGVLKDSNGRTGYIASNRQFQFDAPPQAGAIWTSGFSICGNSSLALASTVWYACRSGSFFNLYDRPAESECSAVYIQTIPSTGSGVINVSQISDGQPQASTATIAPVTQIGDGQIQGPTVTTVVPVTQIGDGQVQAPTATTIVPVTQIGDGQIQAPTTSLLAPVTQISDGQIQAPTTTTFTPITQIGDGQVQAPTIITSATLPTIQSMPPRNTSTPPPPFTGAAADTFVGGPSYYVLGFTAIGAIFGAVLL